MKNQLRIRTVYRVYDLLQTSQVHCPFCSFWMAAVSYSPDEACCKLKLCLQSGLQIWIGHRSLQEHS